MQGMQGLLLWLAASAVVDAVPFGKAPKLPNSEDSAVLDQSSNGCSAPPTQSQGCAWLSDCEVCGDSKCVPHFSTPILDDYAARRAEVWAMEFGICSLVAYVAAGGVIEEFTDDNMNIPCPSAAEIESAQINWHFFETVSELMGHSLSSAADTVAFTSDFCETSSMLGEDVCFGKGLDLALAAETDCSGVRSSDHCSTNPDWDNEECWDTWFDLFGISATTSATYRSTVDSLKAQCSSQETQAACEAYDGSEYLMTLETEQVDLASVTSSPATSTSDGDDSSWTDCYVPTDDEPAPGKGCFFLGACADCGDKKCVAHPKTPQVEELVGPMVESMVNDLYVCRLLAEMVAQDDVGAGNSTGASLKISNDIVNPPRRQLLDDEQVPCPTDTEVDAATFDWGDASDAMVEYGRDISSPEEAKAFIAANCTEMSGELDDAPFPGGMCLSSAYTATLEMQMTHCQALTDDESCDSNIFAIGGECLSQATEMYGITSQAASALRSTVLELQSACEVHTTEEACHEYDGSQYLKTLAEVPLTSSSVSIASSTGSTIAAIMIAALFALHC